MAEGPRTALEELRRQHAALDRELRRLRPEYERLRQELVQARALLKKVEPKPTGVQLESEAFLMSELEVLTKSYEEQQETIQRLQQHLVEKEDANTVLMQESIKAKQVQALLRQEKELLAERARRADERLEAQQEALTKSEQRCKQLQELVARLQQDVQALQVLVEQHKRAAQTSSQNEVDARAQFQQLHEVYEKLKLQHEETQKALHQAQERQQRLEEERMAARYRADRLQERLRRGNVDLELEEELRALKQRLRCPVCNDRFKDAVIAKCFHVFCDICIRKNIELRSRKCPSCGKPFDKSDVHSIYL
jgi:E3 ubiquitin-protein ligase BRE1